MSVLSFVKSQRTPKKHEKAEFEWKTRWFMWKSYDNSDSTGQLFVVVGFHSFTDERVEWKISLSIEWLYFCEKNGIVAVVVIGVEWKWMELKNRKPKKMANEQERKEEE